MKIWKLVSGILPILQFEVVASQSCAVGNCSYCHSKYYNCEKRLNKEVYLLTTTAQL